MLSRMLLLAAFGVTVISGSDTSWCHGSANQTCRMICPDEIKCQQAGMCATRTQKGDQACCHYTCRCESMPGCLEPKCDESCETDGGKCLIVEPNNECTDCPTAKCMARPEPIKEGENCKYQDMSMNVIDVCDKCEKGTVETPFEGASIGGTIKATCERLVVKATCETSAWQVVCKLFAVDKTKSKKQQKTQKRKLVKAAKKKANDVFWNLCKPQYTKDIAAAKKTKGRKAKKAATNQVKKWYASHKKGLKQAQKALGRC